MLRDEVTWDRGWSAERPTISLQNWGFEPTCLGRLSYVTNNSFLPVYEISVRILDTKACDLPGWWTCTVGEHILGGWCALCVSVGKEHGSSALKSSLCVLPFGYSWFIFSSVQLLSRIRLFATPWTTARQASLSTTNSQSPPKPMSIESVTPSNHLILCCPLLILLSIFPSIRVFSNESALCIRWPKYWSFSFNSSPSNEHSGLISFRMDWLDLLAVQGTLKSLLQHQSSKAPILRLNIQETKMMASGPITSWQIDGETVETVADFIFLDSKITADGDCSHEIKRHLLLGRKVMTNLDSILKSRDITLSTKVHLVKAMVFPVVMYGCESWTGKKAEHRRIDAFELWCWRRLLRVLLY